MARGTLSWLITIPADGSVPLGGAAPALIGWQVQPHPARTLKDVGCTLVELEVFYPEPSRVQTVLAAIDLSSPVRLHQLPSGAEPYLVRTFKRPMATAHYQPRNDDEHSAWLCIETDMPRLFAN